jgi:hypothetical protein
MRNALVAALLVLGPTPALLAQATSSIVGTIADTTGAVLPGVSVTVTHLETGYSRTLVTDDRGRYHAVTLPLGQYEVRAEVQGFRTAVRRGVTLNVGAEVTIDFQLEVGEVTEEVVVTVEAPLVETTRAAMSGLVDTTQIANLPLSGRSFTDLALLQPGVAWSSTAQSGFNRGFGLKVTISGSKPTQVNYTLDGSDINDNFNQVGSVSGRVLGVDAIREFRVVTSPFSAEYSRASGGEVQIVTRSGTNTFQESLFLFHRNSAFDARNFFDVGDPPPFRMYQFGGSGGGPLNRDRTFFFAAYEGLQERLTTTRISVVPDEGVHRGLAQDSSGQLRQFGVDPRIRPYLDLYPLPNAALHGNGTGDFVWTRKGITVENYFMARVDHRLSNFHSLYGRYVIDNGSREGPENLGLTEDRERNRTQYVSFGLDTTISSRAVNALQISYNRSFLHGDNFVGDPRMASLFSFSNADIPPLVRQINPGGGVVALGADGSLPRTFAYKSSRSRTT